MICLCLDIMFQRFLRLVPRVGDDDDEIDPVLEFRERFLDQCKSYALDAKVSAGPGVRKVVSSGTRTAATCR